MCVEVGVFVFAILKFVSGQVGFSFVVVVVVQIYAPLSHISYDHYGFKICGCLMNGITCEN